MLQDIRKSSQGTAAKIVVGLIIVTFALFGVESIVGSMGGEPEVAEVNGEGIPESTYKRAFEIKRRQLLSQMGESADPDLINEELLGASVLDGLIEQKLLVQDSESKDLYVSDNAIDRYITGIPQFSEDGVFSNERMQSILRGAGLTLQAYRDSLRSEFLIAQPRSALIASAFLLEAEQKEIVALDRQRRTFGTLSVSRDDYMDSVVVSDEEVKTYYEDNKDDFKKPESVDVSYVVIRKEDLLSDVSVTDEEVETLYESEKEALTTEEERDASHILVKINDERSEEQALELIAQVEARLSAGEEFAVVAKEVSEDDGSATSGGSLGAAGRGVYVSDFEEALFSLSEGEVSGPVKTEFGYHLIKLERIVDNGAPSLEEMRDRLQERLADQKADQAYAELAERLADVSYASPDMQEPAEELELELRQLAGVSVETSDEIFSNPKIQRILFSDEILNDRVNSELVEVAEGVGVVFRVEEYHQQGIKNFDQVASDIRKQLQEEKASEFAESVGQAFVVRMVSGEEPANVAQDMGFTWEIYEDVERNRRDLDSDVVSKVFAIKGSDQIKDNVRGYVAADGSFNVVLLMGVQSGEASELSDEESAAISKVLAESSGGVDYRNYKLAKQRKAEIEKI